MCIDASCSSPTGPAALHAGALRILRTTRLLCTGWATSAASRTTNCAQPIYALSRPFPLQSQWRLPKASSSIHAMLAFTLRSTPLAHTIWHRGWRGPTILRVCLRHPPHVACSYNKSVTARRPTKKANNLPPLVWNAAMSPKQHTHTHTHTHTVHVRPNTPAAMRRVFSAICRTTAWKQGERHERSSGRRLSRLGGDRRSHRSHPGATLSS